MFKRTLCDPIVAMAGIATVLAAIALAWATWFPSSPDPESVAVAKAAGRFPKTKPPKATGPTVEDVVRILGDAPDVAERVTD